jgi:hypothetical protein
LIQPGGDEAFEIETIIDLTAPQEFLKSEIGLNLVAGAVNRLNVARFEGSLDLACRRKFLRGKI